MPTIANLVLMIAIGMNFYVLIHLWPQWYYLTILNCSIGLITLLLVWTVQCSDPGIQSRLVNEQTPILQQKQQEGFNLNDSLISLNDYEKLIFDPENYIEAQA